MRFEDTGNGKERGLKRFTTALCRIFRRKGTEQKEEPRREIRETQFEPIVFAPAALKVENVGLGAEAEAYLASLPNGERGAKARKALENETGRRRKALTIDETKEALAMDGSGGSGETIARRDTLFTIMFGNRKEEFIGKEILMRRESINVFYYRMDDFQKVRCVLRGKGEQECLRAKGEDREKALGEMERILNLVAAKERMDAFRLIAEIVVKMGGTLCSKEVCGRISFIRMNVEGAEGNRISALEEFAAFVKEHGVRPSVRNLQSLTPRSEERRMREWIWNRPEGIRAAAEAVLEVRRPKSFQEFIQMLEEETNDEVERRLFVGEQVLGRWTTTRKEFAMLDDHVARNVAYYCIKDILKVTSLADCIADEEAREAAKKEALETILKVAKRMPGGRRMEAPALVAKLAGILMDPQKPRSRQWIVGVWLLELRAYMMEPDKERAYKKLTRLCVTGNPMEVVEG
ncbi:MAG: hypothetical protein NTY83_01080 [Candidatus Micrarchaeota archaeon]|nr:hypothetical protein [Candidatus Micrarchaeota archaeon]